MSTKSLYILKKFTTEKIILCSSLISFRRLRFVIKKIKEGVSETTGINDEWCLSEMETEYHLDVLCVTNGAYVEVYKIMCKMVFCFFSCIKPHGGNYIFDFFFHKIILGLLYL